MADVDMDEKTQIRLNIASSLGCASRAFIRLRQEDGPLVGYYNCTVDDETARHKYQSFAWRHADHRAVSARVDSFAASLEKDGKSIVWRERPQFYYENGEYIFYCRLHVLPYEKLPGDKPECEAIPVAPDCWLLQLHGPKPRPTGY